MPSSEVTSGESGRESASEKKRAAGAEPTGVMPKRFEAKTAPSGALPVEGGRMLAMMELSGSARPRMPSKSRSRGSSWTVVTAATGRLTHHGWGKEAGGRGRTQSLKFDTVAADLD